MSMRGTQNSSLTIWSFHTWLPFGKNISRHHSRQCSILTSAPSGIETRETVARTIEMIAAGLSTVDAALAEAFSFQRPSIIASNFKLIDPKLDLAGVMRKPYRGEKQSLFDSIESLVEDRNEFVHTGKMNWKFTDNI